MHIMFWGCNCIGDITVCVNKMSMKTFTVCTHYTERGCMTCEEKQEMHYQRYLNLSEYFVHSRYVNF